METFANEKAAFIQLEQNNEKSEMKINLFISILIDMHRNQTQKNPNQKSTNIIKQKR